MVAMTDLDHRVNDEIRVEPRDNVEEWQLGKEGQNTHLGQCFNDEEIEKIKKILTDKKNLFAWTAEEMPGIDPRVM